MNPLPRIGALRAVVRHDRGAPLSRPIRPVGRRAGVLLLAVICGLILHGHVAPSPSTTGPTLGAARPVGASAAPAVSSVLPAQGVTAGGTAVAIIGSGFIGVTDVEFGGVPAASFIVDSPSQLRVVSPPHQPGAVAIAVTAGGGTATAAYTYVEGAPVLYSFTPNVVFTDTVVTILGAGLSGTTAVTDSNGYPVGSFTVVSDFEIQATGVIQTSNGSSGEVEAHTPRGTSNVLDLSSIPYPGSLSGVTPSLVLDTRAGSGTQDAGHPLQPWSTFDASSRLASATGPGMGAQLLQVTVLNATRPGWLRLAARTDDVPNIPTISFSPGPPHTELVTPGPQAGPQTMLILDGPGTVDVVIQLVGAPNPGGQYVPLPTARVADTRPGSGSPYAGLTLQPGVPLDIQATGAGGVPASGVDQVAVRVAAVGARQAGHVTVRPPLSSWSVDDVDAVVGADAVNLAVVPVGVNGDIELVTDTAITDVAVDVVGWLTPATQTGQNLRVLGNARVPLLDTRDDSGAPGEGQHPAAGSVVTLPVAGHGDIPTMTEAKAPKAVVLLVTVSNTGAAGGLEIYAGSTVPPGADVIWRAGDGHSSLVVVPVNYDGSVRMHADSGSFDVSVLAIGWLT